MLIIALDHFLPDMGVKSEEKDCIFQFHTSALCMCGICFSYLLCVCIVNQLFFSNKTKSKGNIEAHVDTRTHRCVGQPHEPCRGL